MTPEPRTIAKATRPSLGFFFFLAPRVENRSSAIISCHGGKVTRSDARQKLLTTRSRRTT